MSSESSMAWPPSTPIITASLPSRLAARMPALSVQSVTASGRRLVSVSMMSMSSRAKSAAPRLAYAGGTYDAKNDAVMPLSCSERRSACASVSCSSRCTLCRKRRYGVSQWPSTMIARRCRSLAEIVIDAIELPRHLIEVIEDELRLRQQLLGESPAPQRHHRQRDAM